MLFNSFEFAVFFPLVVLLYFLLPHKYRWALLLVASYYFYMCWKVEYAILLVISTLIDYLAARRMGGLSTKRERKPWMWFSVIVNVGLLFTFKYFNFFNGELNAWFVDNGLTYPIGNLELLLPMGISFYTFQTMSYTIDIYRGDMQPTSHLGKFALYVTFFPQLVAGPVERAKQLLPQFDIKVRAEYSRIASGLKQMLWGFFKKLVIADNVALVVNQVYGDVGGHDWSMLLLGSYLFSVQAYCDFSGYTDIAIGAARVMGIDLMDNFRTPYLSRSIKEFWKRWHISLMTWFRDYIYMPMGGNRVVRWRWYYNILVVFLISGLWHGANWTYILFGGLHGLYIVGTLVFAGWIAWIDRTIGWAESSKIRKWVNIVITFHLVTFSWFLFRATDVNDSWVIAQKVFSLSPDGLGLATFLELISPKLALILGLSVLFLFVDPFLDGLVKGERKGTSSTSQILLFAGLVVSIALLGYFGKVEFIYFQF